MWNERGAAGMSQRIGRDLGQTGQTRRTLSDASAAMGGRRLRLADEREPRGEPATERGKLVR